MCACSQTRLLRLVELLRVRVNDARVLHLHPLELLAQRLRRKRVKREMAIDAALSSKIIGGGYGGAKQQGGRRAKREKVLGKSVGRGARVWEWGESVRSQRA
eukprot:6207464-Pleurochrysis_carterae.AAC.2